MQVSELFLTAVNLMVQQAENENNFNAIGQLQNMVLNFYALPTNLQNLVIETNQLSPSSSAPPPFSAGAQTAPKVGFLDVSTKPLQAAQLDAHTGGAGAASIQQQVIRDHLDAINSDPEIKAAHDDAIAKSQALAADEAVQHAAQLEAMKHPPGWEPPPVDDELKAELADDLKAHAEAAAAEPGPVNEANVQSASGAVETE